ncbi:MAG: SPFH domain-containing protein [Planctomycetia bacterium]|nr:SPFH domain-containing protein [Planctomycetia bacterium]
MSNHENTTPTGAADDGWRGLVWTSACLSFGCATILTLYGTKIYGAGSLLLAALSLPLWIGFLSAVLRIDAGRMRKKLLEIRQWRKPDWGENVENPYEIEFDQKKIVHFFLLGLLPCAILTIAALYMAATWTGEKMMYIPQNHLVLASILCAGACIIWLMVARTYRLAAEEEGVEDKELRTLGECAWESCWWLGIASLVLLVESGLGKLDPNLAGCCEAPFAWVIFFWVLAALLELMTRLVIGWMTTRTQSDSFTTPISVFLRYMIFVRGNPIQSFFFMLEQKWGVSFRSSWAIRFVARSTFPALVLVLFTWWALSSLYVVQLNEFGVRRDFGKIHEEIIQPGLHLKLPYPFGSVQTYPVKKVEMLPVGFDQSNTEQLSFLWSRKHGKEYELLLESGNRSIVIHIMVHYKIKEDPGGFFEYVKQFQNPQDVVYTFATRCLTELTHKATLAEIFSIQRDLFAKELHDRLQKYMDGNKMGVEIVEVSMLNLHPPTGEAAKGYLELISAGIDKKRMIVRAEKEYEVQLLQAQQQYSNILTQAEVVATQNVGTARAETFELLAVGKSFDLNPECFQLRYWLNAVQDILARKRLIITDDSIEVLYDMQDREQRDDASRALIRAQ